MKILFLPQCLKQELSEKIKQVAKSKGYEIHTVAGGSMVKNILKEYKNQKIDEIVGIACKDELKLAIEYTKPLANNGTQVKTIQLLKDGCKNTEVNLDEVIEKLK